MANQQASAAIQRFRDSKLERFKFKDANMQHEFTKWQIDKPAQENRDSKVQKFRDLNIQRFEGSKIVCLHDSRS